MSAGSRSSSLVFIDTNIWLYAFSQIQDIQKAHRARVLIRGTSQIVLSTQVINEVAVNLLRKFQAAESDIRKLIRSFYRKYLIIEHSRAILLHASDLRTVYRVSYWDSLILSSALAAGATILYTEDMQEGLMVANQLTIVNPLRDSS
ncbi:MAG: twitching motility protein PilT [Roseiflexus sp.]|nr:MAG: twitching motility protein PilT [Roseiflexus sp.]